MKTKASQKIISLKMPIGANYQVFLKQLTITFDGTVKIKATTLDGKKNIYVHYQPISRTIKKTNLGRLLK